MKTLRNKLKTKYMIWKVMRMPRAKRLAYVDKLYNDLRETQSWMWKEYEKATAKQRADFGFLDHYVPRSDK